MANIPADVLPLGSSVLPGILSMDVDVSSMVIKALKYIKILFQSPDVLRQLFRPLCDEFLEKSQQVSDEVFDSVIQRFISVGFNLAIDQIFITSEPNKRAYLQMHYRNYFDKIERQTNLPKPTIYLDSYLASNERGNIQCYFHFIKLLHEVAHILTPAFIGLSNSTSRAVPASKLTAPNKIGPISSRKGDIGSGWEDLILGGRVLIDVSNCNCPFRNHLVLMSLVYKDIHPLKGNTIKKKINMEYVDTLIGRLDSWVEDPTNVPFPDLNIPDQSCENITSHHIFQSREEAIGVINRSKMNKFNVVGSRKSKRSRTNHQPKNALYGEDHKDDLNESDSEEQDIYNAIYCSEEEDNYCDSIVCGGISEEMLALMEKDPTLKF